MLKAKTHFRGLVNRQNHLSLVRLGGLVNHQSAHYCSAGWRGLVIWSLAIACFARAPFCRSGAPGHVRRGASQQVALKSSPRCLISTYIWFEVFDILLLVSVTCWSMVMWYQLLISVKGKMAASESRGLVGEDWRSYSQVDAGREGGGIGEMDNF